MKGLEPIGVQRKRTRGWKMPENTVSVTRPGKFGNPFRVGDLIRLGTGGMGFAYLICKDPKYNDGSFKKINTAQEAVDLYEEYITKYPLKDIEELRGKNLACFCPIDQPCHRNVLLKFANRKRI
jgi:hypothetical protein